MFSCFLAAKQALHSSISLLPPSSGTVLFELAVKLGLLRLVETQGNLREISGQSQGNLRVISG
jgi:hypothetical protein